MTVQVRIVTPRRVAFEGAATEVRAPAFHGEFGALEGHERFLAVVRPGRCVVTTPEGDVSFVVGSGFVEVGAGHLTLLTDHCEPAGGADRDQAVQDLRDAEQALTALQDGTVAWDEAQRRADLARARLG